MVNLNNVFGSNGLISTIAQKIRDLVDHILHREKEIVDLQGKIVLFDNDELLLVWEDGLRNKRIKKEENAWKGFEKEFGKGSPRVTEAFIKWQENLYEYIEQEKDRFLKERQGVKTALNALLQSGAKVIVVTKGAKPYTQKCFNLVGLSFFVSDIYSPAPGKRVKRFADAVRDYGKDTSRKYLQDTIIVGHDLDKDMAWDLVPPKAKPNDGNAPVFILFDTLKFDQEEEASLDALPEIIALLSKRGNNDFLQGFKTINTPEEAQTKHYIFKIALYHNPKRKNKAKIPVIYDIKKR
ncbi:MAG: HAD family hydrolase, partial [Candidatus Hydrogenedentes bacterium]|nr:HAD family hydrolase [Candidatus Hydrogenedentota bacterium]